MKNSEFDFFEKIINNLDIEILEHGDFIGDENWKYYNINSPFNRLYIVTEGEAIIQGRKYDTTLKPGFIYLIPMYTTNDYICSNYVKKYYFHFSLKLFNSIDLFELTHNHIILPIKEAQIESLGKKLKNKNIADMLACKAIISDILSDFLQELPESVFERVVFLHKYNEVFRYIRENCFHTLTTSEVQNIFQQTIPNLHKSFKKDMGISLRTYINGCIIQIIKEQLLLTEKSIKEIAYEMRFCDEFYFSHFYKKHTGLSPKSYRLMNKIKPQNQILL